MQYSMRAREVENLLEEQEKELGQMHPHVGKTCAVLSKLYMKTGGEDGLQKAAAALTRAWSICRTCQISASRVTHADKSFRFLHDYIRNLQ